MNSFDAILLAWAITATIIAIFEFVFLAVQLDDSTDIEVSYMRKIAKLNEKLTKTESKNLELKMQIKELKNKANKQPVRAKVRKREENRND